ncbi:UNVERIFIED_CONTAM: hypothetical protein K2H54_052157 [Gekko kuhli]
MGKKKGSGQVKREQKPTSSHLFQAEHFQRLLTKVISTLNYRMETPEVPRSSASANLDPRGFKKPVKFNWSRNYHGHFPRDRTYFIKDPFSTRTRAGYD